MDASAVQSTPASGARLEARHGWRRTIRRRSIAVAVLGALTSIGIAWVIAVYDGPSIGTTPVGASIAFTAPSAPGEQSISLLEWRLPGRTVIIASPWLSYRDTEPPAPLDEIRPAWARQRLIEGATHDEASPVGRAIMITGWPFPCLWCSFEEQPSPGWWWYRSMDGIKVLDAPASPSTRDPLCMRERTLPLRVDGPALLGCILFWAGVWAIVLFGPGALIRARRRRRGRCAWCGHDRRGLEPGRACPECGDIDRRAPRPTTQRG